MLGSPRGGGTQSEPTDPDYVDKRLARLKQEYLACAPEWRQVFLDGLSRWEQKYVQGKITL
jgi:hypothetical protein